MSNMSISRETDSRQTDIDPMDAECPLILQGLVRIAQQKTFIRQRDKCYTGLSMLDCLSALATLINARCTTYDNSQPVYTSTSCHGTDSGDH